MTQASTPQLKLNSSTRGPVTVDDIRIQEKDCKDPHTPTNLVESLKGGSDKELSTSVPQDPFVTHRWLANTQFIFLCWSLFMAGWNDASTGPLLPRIQEVYHVGYTVVSIIFIANCIGFVSGSISNIWLTRKLGFGKAIVLGAFLQLVGYSLQSPGPIFPVFCIGFAINGFGLSLQDAQANGYVANYKTGASTKMGILHGVYGLGALCAPLVATQFAQQQHWSYHYLCSFGVGVINILGLAFVFRLKTQDDCFAAIGQEPPPEDTSEGGHYGQIFSLRALHIIAFFSLVYVGVEVTIGSWTVTYIINDRNGGASSGYISSGFFGGLALGRVALLWLNKLVGERNVIFLYIIAAIGLELIVWLVPSLIGGAVAVSFVGFVLGPIYPIMMNESGRVLPRWLLTGCIGWIAGLGQTGSAALPFITGAIAGKAGIWSLQPLLIGMMGLLFILWALVPRPKKEDVESV